MPGRGEYLNENAPPNARVMIRGSHDVADFYARPDLDFDYILLKTTPEQLAEYDYLVMTTGHRHQLKFVDPDDYPNAYEVYAGKTLMAVAKKIGP